MLSMDVGLGKNWGRWGKIIRQILAKFIITNFINVMSKSRKNSNLLLGIDIGGTGIKGGIVDLTKGTLVGERVRIDTPPTRHPGGHR